jgi:hypothetical protein
MSDLSAIKKALTNYDRAKLAEYVRTAQLEHKAILKLFPLERWQTMKLEDYALGHESSKKSFCYWLEFKTKWLGSIGGGSAQKHCIYFHHKDGWTFNRNAYRSIEEAWNGLRSGFMEAFNRANKDEFDSIDKIDSLEWVPMVRTKTLYVYFPEKILPVYSIRHIRYFLKLLGDPAANDPQDDAIRLNRVLLKKLRELPESKGLSNLEIMNLLYERFDPASELENEEFPLSKAQMEELWRRFRRDMPDFVDFTTPGATFKNNELDYKRRILKRYQDELGRDKLLSMLAEGGAGQARDLLARIAGSNLVQYQNWRSSLGEEEARTAALLSAFLQVTEKPYERSSDLKPLFAAAEAHEAKLDWDVVSTLLWVMRPEDYFPIKISYFRKLAEELGFELPSGRPGPNNLARLLSFGRAFRKALADQKPQDWVDVQSFIYCVCPAKESNMPNRHDETKPATENPTSPDFPLNQILYGPPGTGKTYSTIRKAVEIIDGRADGDEKALKTRYDQLVSQRRVAFVTFHQTFSYEDFVEGIRPVMDQAGKASMPLYECRDGVFKTMCTAARARLKTLGSATEVDPSSVARFWKMSLGNTWDPDEADIYAHCIARNQIAHGYGRGKDFSPSSSKEAVATLLKSETWGSDESPSYHITAVDMLKNQMQKGDLVIITDGNHKFRAIGRISGPYAYRAGEDYPQTRPVEWLRVFEESQPKERILKDRAFSMQALYRIEAGAINMESLRELLSAQKDTAPGNYVLIIDEINRGNISKIFGELITLLEPDKREGQKHALTTTLPYSQTQLAVPPNLYVIGTMNTADKSIALVDVALRRRFRFEELMPRYDLVPEFCRNILAELNRRIVLRKDRDHQIGHSFLMSVKYEADFNQVFADCIRPLLQEYFFNDWDGLRFVLADDKANDQGFIRRLDGGEVRDARNKWAWYHDKGVTDQNPFQRLSSNYGQSEST